MPPDRGGKLTGPTAPFILPHPIPRLLSAEVEELLGEYDALVKAGKETCGPQAGRWKF